MTERMPNPEQSGEEQEEQIEMFKEEELGDPDKDTRKLLEFIKEADAKAKKEKREKRRKKTA